MKNKEYDSYRELIRRLINWSKGIPQPPLRVEFWISGKCNLRCRFCGSWKDNNQDKLNTKDFIRIINKSKKMGVKEFYISGGGEPFYRKDVTLKIMKKIKKVNGIGFIITNGALLTKKDINQIIKIEWDMLTISLDGPSPKEHDYLRGVDGTFEKVINNIEYISYLKERKKKSKPYVYINSVINRINYKKIPDLLVLSAKLNVNEVIFQPLFGSGTFYNNLRIKEKNLTDFKKIVLKAEKLASKYKIKTNISEYKNLDLLINSNCAGEIMCEHVKKEEGFLAIPCYEPWWHLFISFNGNAAPCGPWVSKSSENVLDSSIEEIWFGDFFNSFREKIKRKNMNGCNCCMPILFFNNRLRESLKAELQKHKK